MSGSELSALQDAYAREVLEHGPERAAARLRAADPDTWFNLAMANILSRAHELAAATADRG